MPSGLTTVYTGQVGPLHGDAELEWDVPAFKTAVDAIFAGDGTRDEQQFVFVGADVWRRQFPVAERVADPQSRQGASSTS